MPFVDVKSIPSEFTIPAIAAAYTPGKQQAPKFPGCVCASHRRGRPPLLSVHYTRSDLVNYVQCVDVLEMLVEISVERL